MIRLENVTVSYGTAQAVAGVSARLTGDFICVIGENGSGKSSLLRAMGGVTPYSGQILLEDQPLERLSRRQRALRLAYLPQLRPLPAMDVASLIALGRWPRQGLSGTRTPEDRAAEQEAAERAGVSGLLKRRLDSLSGGECQRAYLAMLCARQARVLLLDEPMSFLDLRHQLQFLEVLDTLRWAGTRIVMATHDLPQAFSVSRELLLLSGGRLTAQGAPERLCHAPALREALGVTLRPTEGGIYGYLLTR